MVYRSEPHSSLASAAFPSFATMPDFIQSAPDASVLFLPASFSTKTTLRGDRSLGDDHACLD
jgi:hypothetical protein